MIAPPRMKLYMQYSARIYSLFLKWIAKEDIHVYSIDEAFLDVTSYLSLYKTDAKSLAHTILTDIFEETGITATAGIGTNLYLAKIALDITAKHNRNNMGYLDEETYRYTLWHHTPLTDFWRIGQGTLRRLASIGIQDMYGIAHCDPSILYRMFGVNAEYLIDHAWGRESCEIRDIKAYQPSSTSMSNSQILFEDYTYTDAYLVLKEMVENNVLTLTEKHVVTNHISLSVGYSKDRHPSSHGGHTLSCTTNCYPILLEEFKKLYKRIVNPGYPIRQISISFGNIQDEYFEQYDLFQDYTSIEENRHMQESLVAIKKKYGRNSILKGMNCTGKSTQKKRNTLIGGHNA